MEILVDVQFDDLQSYIGLFNLCNTKLHILFSYTRTKGPLLFSIGFFFLKWEQPHVGLFQVSLYGLKGLHTY